MRPRCRLPSEGDLKLSPKSVTCSGSSQNTGYLLRDDSTAIALPMKSKPTRCQLTFIHVSKLEDYSVAASLKIGRYIAITNVPTMPPIKTMIKGSKVWLSVSTALLTSSS